MGELVKFEAADGSFMVVDTAPVGGRRLDLVTKQKEGEASTAVTRLEDSLASVRGAAVAFMATVDDLRKRDAPLTLDEVSLDLAMSFGVEGGVIVAKGSASAEASVTLTWHAKPASG